MSRKNILRALDGSLQRLRTDYVDLYIMHTWDRVTPVEEVAATLNDLVHCGKIRHLGLSDVPAWYASRFATIADLRRLGTTGDPSARIIAPNASGDTFRPVRPNVRKVVALKTFIAIPPIGSLVGRMTSKYIEAELTPANATSLNACDLA
ncbi:MAG: aldo/keto reductase [Terriglobales bacterium]